MPPVHALDLLGLRPGFESSLDVICTVLCLPEEASKSVTCGELLCVGPNKSKIDGAAKPFAKVPRSVRSRLMGCHLRPSFGTFDLEPLLSSSWRPETSKSRA